MDLGYIMNPGFTGRRGENDTDHNVFRMKAEVELADHVNTSDGTIVDVHFAVKFGDIIVVGE